MLFGRYVQPIEIRQTRRKVNITMRAMTKSKRDWKRNADGKPEVGKWQFRLESVLVRSTSNCRAEDFKTSCRLV